MRGKKVLDRVYLLGPEIPLYEESKRIVVDKDENDKDVVVESPYFVVGYSDYSSSKQPVCLMQVAILKSGSKPGLDAQCFFVKDGDVRNPQITIAANGMSAFNANGQSTALNMIENISYLDEIAKKSLESAQKIHEHIRHKRMNRIAMASVFSILLGVGGITAHYFMHKDDAARAAVKAFDEKDVDLTGLEITSGEGSKVEQAPTYANADVAFADIPTADHALDGVVRKVAVTSGSCDAVATLAADEVLKIAKDAKVSEDVLVVRSDFNKVYVCVPSQVVDSNNYLQDISVVVEKTGI